MTSDLGTSFDQMEYRQLMNHCYDQFEPGNKLANCGRSRETAQQALLNLNRTIQTTAEELKEKECKEIHRRLDRLTDVVQSLAQEKLEEQVKIKKHAWKEEQTIEQEKKSEETQEDKPLFARWKNAFSKIMSKSPEEKSTLSDANSVASEKPQVQVEAVNPSAKQRWKNAVRKLNTVEITPSTPEEELRVMVDSNSKQANELSDLNKSLNDLGKKLEAQKNDAEKANRDTSRSESSKLLSLIRQRMS